MTQDDSLERAIVGALRAAIHDHGPITLAQIGSAAKRILGQLRNVPGGLARLLGKRRWEGSTAKQRKAFSTSGASLGGKHAWAGMTKAERSAEGKRRAAVRRKAKEGT